MQKVTIILEDDLDGSEANQTITFGLDGATYEIDLNEKNAAALRKVLDKYTAKARKVTGTRGKTSKAISGGPKASEVRAWAQAQGLDVPARGRIPAEVRQQYDAAN